MVQISLSKWGSGLILALLQCQHVECSLDRFVDFGVNGDGVDVG